MKILQINSSDFAHGGGGAVAMHRLYQGLKQSEIDCKILSGLKTLESSDSAAIPRSDRLEFHLQRLTSGLGLNDIHCLSSFFLKKHPFYQEADLLNLHVIHSGYFNYLALPLLTKSKPAVLTLHDMWSFTGHCAYSYECQRWQFGCGQCPSLKSYPPVSRDMTRFEWIFKNFTYRHSQLAIVTISSWMESCVSQSMLRHFPRYHIPNGLNTTLYTPYDPGQSRSELHIPKDKYVLMFGAANVLDPRKGGDILCHALQNLPTSLKRECLLVSFGHFGADISAMGLDIPVYDLGYVCEDQIKAKAYSAADLFLFPTRADNLPLVLQESMACGTPMVSCDVGGVSDLVRHNVTGYLAQPENVGDFTQGILTLLEDKAGRERMKLQCRAIACEEYSLSLQTERYIDMYRQILGMTAS